MNYGIEELLEVGDTLLERNKKDPGSAFILVTVYVKEGRKSMSVHTNIPMSILEEVMPQVLPYIKASNEGVPANATIN